MENQLQIALGANKFFEGLTISDFDLSSFKGNLFTIKEGEILYREGDPFRYIYFVISGELNLLSPHILGNSNSIIISANAFLGHDEYLNQSNRLSTVVALRDSYIIGFNRSEIQSLIGQDERILIKLKESRYLNLKTINAQSNSENSEPEENFAEQNLEQNIDERDENTAQQSEILNNDVDTAKIVDPENFESPGNQEEQESNFDLDNLKSDAEPEQNLEQSKEEKSKTPHSAILNDDVDAAMVVEPENFESPEDYEEQEDNFDLDNLKSDAEPHILPTDEDKKEFKLLEDNEEEKVSTEPLGENLTVEEFDTEEDNQFLNGISSEEELRKIDELIQSESAESEINKEEENLRADKIQEENFISQEIEEEDSIPEKNIQESENSATEITREQNNENLTSDDNLESLSEENDDDVVVKSDEANNLNKENIDTNEANLHQSINDIKPENQEIENETQQAKETEVNSGLSTEKLDMIIKAAELVNSNIKIQDVLANIVTVAADLVNADRGTLYLVEEDKGKLWSEVAMGDELKEIHLTIGEGIAGTVAQTGETINIPDASEDERFESSFDKLSGYTTKSILCLPIKNKENVIVGVLQLLNSKNGEFSKLDEELLNTLSIFIALALENANLVEQLLKTERIDSLGKMTNFLIQDIKKPVLVSKRYAEHLLGKELNPDFRQVLEMMDDQLNHVADLVQTTSSYSQGHSILRAIPQSINNTLTEFSNRLDAYFRTSNCSFSTEFDKDVVVKIDSKEFYQCFYQIVRNAVEAMPDGGNLKVTTVAKENEVLISFTDNGLGINESLLDKIFEPFMTFGKKNGTGLGLSITKKVIEDHGGSISVESALGEGAVFTITLPIANAV